MLLVFNLLVTLVEEERAFFCYRLLVVMWFLFGEISFSFWSLGKAALFYYYSFIIP